MRVWTIHKSYSKNGLDSANQVAAWVRSGKMVEIVPSSLESGENRLCKTKLDGEKCSRYLTFM